VQSNNTTFSIRAGVLSRVVRLPADDQSLLSSASVIGNRFELRLLAEVAERPLTRIIEVLEAARELTLVRESAGDDFEFRHAITREVVYGEMTGARRRALHANVAERLAASATESDPARIAQHWAAAGEFEKAADAAERAGDEASARDIYRDAASAYGWAVDWHDPRDERSAKLCAKLAVAYFITGNTVESCKAHERAIATYVAIGKRAWAAPQAIMLASRYSEAAELDRARSAVERALELIEHDGDASDAYGTPAWYVSADSIRYAAHVSLAHFAVLEGHSEDALAWLSRAEALGVPPPGYRATVHVVRASALSMHGRLAEAFDDYETAVRIAQESGSNVRLIWALNSYASRALAVGRTALAIATYRDADECAGRSHNGNYAALATYGLALAHLSRVIFAPPARRWAAVKRSATAPRSRGILPRPSRCGSPIYAATTSKPRGMQVRVRWRSRSALVRRSASGALPAR
jgi:tetratricopeptide (TPR) repeat protein